MRSLLYVLSFVLTTATLCFGQTEAITNIRVRLDTTGKIRIMYDLNWIKPSDSVYMEARGRQSGPLTIRSIEGDVGKFLMVGRNKKAYWNIVKDGHLIDEEIRIGILIKPKKEILIGPNNPQAIGGGPANALLSAVLPGVGNIFVQPKTKKHRIGFRPLLPIVFYGLVGFSTYRWIQASNRFEIYSQQVREDVAQPIFEDANNKRHQSILAAGVAASIWTIDVACTFIKGVKNNKVRNTQSIGLGILNGTPIIGLKLNL